MCGRFYIPQPDDTPEALALLLSEAQNREERHQPGFRLKRGQISPGDPAAVLAPDRKRQTRAFVMRWGFRTTRPAQSSAAAPKEQLVFNARSETAAQRRMFADSMQQRHCLIPCTAYFEWDHRTKPYTKYIFQPKAQQLTWLCGLYRITPEGPEFTVLTREAAPSIACFHDRMPVMLPDDMAMDWLELQGPASRMFDYAIQDVSFAQCV